MTAGDASQFGDLREDALRALGERDPVWARATGDHAFDARVPDYALAAIDARDAHLEAILHRLQSIDAASLSPDDSLDRAILSAEIAQRLFDDRERELPRTSPTFYAGAFLASGYLDDEDAPPESLAMRVVAHAEAGLAQAHHVRANLRLPLARATAEAGARAYRSFAESLRRVPEDLASLTDASLRERAAARASALAGEAEAIAAWLEAEAPKGDESNRLGTARFARMLALRDGVSSLDAFRKRGEDDLLRNRAARGALGSHVHSTHTSEEHLAIAKKAVERARAFVTARKLVTMPGDAQVEVRPSPPYMRGSPAAIELDGPHSAFFDVALPDPSWPEERRRASFVERGVLEALALHEVYPGHLVQMRLRERAPTATQRRIVSLTFVEGWAHYAEQMMIDEGWGEGPEARAGQLDAAILRDARYLAAIGIHADGWSMDRARAWFESCGVSADNAKAEANRAALDPTVYAYTLGKLEILALREEARRKLGTRFSLRAFHDALLAHGAPPISIVRARVLADLTADPHESITPTSP